MAIMAVKAIRPDIKPMIKSVNSKKVSTESPFGVLILARGLRIVVWAKARLGRSKMDQTRILILSSFCFMLLAQIPRGHPSRAVIDARVRACREKYRPQTIDDDIGENNNQ